MEPQIVPTPHADAGRSHRLPGGRALARLLCLAALVIFPGHLFAQAERPQAPAPAVTAVTTAPALFSAAELKALPPERIASGPAVRIRGAITYLANQPSILFVQDDTGGICVFGPREPAIRRLLKPGVGVEIQGVVAAGRGGPYLAALPREPLAITILSEEPRPIEPLPTTLGALLALRASGELVEVQATCRSVRVESFGPQQDALIITLADASQRLELASLNWNTTGNIPRTWVGANIRVKGVFNSIVTDRQQVAAMRLLINNFRDVSIVTPATPAGELKITPAATVGGLTAEQPRTRLQGVVTLALAGKGMYLQDDTAGVWIDALPSAPAPPAPGDKVDVVGFAALRAGAPLLEDAVWTSMGAVGLPPAPAVTADEALSGAFHARRIQMDALVLEVSRLSEGSTLVLQAGERVFLARLAGPPDAETVPAAENSWVRVAGVCVNNRAPVDVSAASADVSTRPVSFHLMLPGPQSISVIRAPNWWSLQRVLFVIGVLLLSALAAMAWVVALRRRVIRQTVQIHRHIHQETLNEERMRIARELHDSLEQDLLGITMQLKATDKLLDRPERARASLQLASAMVRRSQAETHRAVWDLRERKVGQEGLVPTLRSALAGLTSGGSAAGGGAAGPKIDVTVSGQERELPPQTENHLLRVALESVTNAFKHADADRVHVRIDFEHDRVVLEVTDDGRGFDADHPPMPHSGHFGLFGMKERADKLHGALSITSHPGETKILLVAPTNGKA